MLWKIYFIINVLMLSRKCYMFCFVSSITICAFEVIVCTFSVGVFVIVVIASSKPCCMYTIIITCMLSFVVM